MLKNDTVLDVILAREHTSNNRGFIPIVLVLVLGVCAATVFSVHHEAEQARKERAAFYERYQMGPRPIGEYTTDIGEHQ